MPYVQTGRLPKGHRPPTSVWCSILECVCGHNFNRRKWNRNTTSTQYGYQCYDTIHTGSVQTRKNKGLSLDDVCDTPMIQEWKLQMMSPTILSMLLLKRLLFQKTVLIGICDTLPNRLYLVVLRAEKERQTFRLPQIPPLLLLNTGCHQGLMFSNKSRRAIGGIFAIFWHIKMKRSSQSNSSGLLL